MGIAKIAPKSNYFARAIEVEKLYQVLDESVDIIDLLKKTEYKNEVPLTTIKHDINTHISVDSVQEALNKLSDYEFCDYLNTKGYNFYVKDETDYIIKTGEPNEVFV